MKRWFFILLLVGVACQNTKKEEVASQVSVFSEVPPSYLSFRVNFPVSQLESGINSILPTQLISGSFPLKDKGDSLHLTIKRESGLKLAIRKGKVYATVPLKVGAAVTKKVLGVTFSNQDSPLYFSGDLQASTEITMDDSWNMNFNCTYIGFVMKDRPDFNILGISVNLGKAVEKALDERKDELSDLICTALGNAIDFRKIVNKVWNDLQKPQRIAKNPSKVWLYSSPVALNGQLMPLVRDTLAIHLEYRTVIQISPILQISDKRVALSPRGIPLNQSDVLLAYPELVLPFSFIEQSLEEELRNQNFEYEGYQFQITSVKVNSDRGRLRFTFQTKGDLNGEIQAVGSPAFTQDRMVIIEDFSFKVEASEQWIKLADWAIHQLAENYVSEQVKFDLNPFFDDLGGLITEGLSKSKVGDKLNLAIDFSNIKSYDLQLTEEAMQWIFFAEGSARIDLREGVFKKKIPD